MPVRPSSLALALLGAIALGGPAPAIAQDSMTLPDGTQLPDLPQSGDGDTGGDVADPGVGEAPVDTPPADDAEAEDPAPTTPASTTGADATAGAQGTTPYPPPYLAPGPAAATQPVSSVAKLVKADLPAEPLRLGALVGALIAALLVGGAALLRALGLRTPVVDPVAPARDGRLSGIGERLRATADDMRDFLRRSR
ncbi:MAG: hypothetical protein PGN13_03615 [Patulibacter minatonensis]